MSCLSGLNGVTCMTYIGSIHSVYTLCRTRQCASMDMDYALCFNMLRCSVSGKTPPPFMIYRMSRVMATVASTVGQPWDSLEFDSGAE